MKLKKRIKIKRLFLQSKWLPLRWKNTILTRKLRVKRKVINANSFFIWLGLSESFTIFGFVSRTYSFEFSLFILWNLMSSHSLNPESWILCLFFGIHHLVVMNLFLVWFFFQRIATLKRRTNFINELQLLTIFTFLARLGIYIYIGEINPLAAPRGVWSVCANTHLFLASGYSIVEFRRIW